MPSPPSGPAAWPRWLAALASAPIVFHLGAVSLAAVTARSGPWPTPEGPGMAVPPPAAAILHEAASLPYLQGIALPDSYHFPSSVRVATADAYLEVHLEDEAGKAMKTVRFPDPDAPPLVRRRQAQLIRWLVEDQPATPPRGTERIYPPGQIPPRVPVWDVVGERRLALAEVPETELPRNRIVFRPTAWSLIVVRSIARHESRVHGAAYARVVRHSREAASPEWLMNPQGIPPAFEDLVSDYGRISR